MVFRIGVKGFDSFWHGRCFAHWSELGQVICKVYATTASDRAQCAIARAITTHCRGRPMGAIALMTRVHIPRVLRMMVYAWYVEYGLEVEKPQGIGHM